MTVFTNPYQEMEEEERKLAEQEAKRRAKEDRLLDPADPDNKVGVEGWVCGVGGSGPRRTGCWT